ncbi:ELMO domain-containing protein C-like [Drosophila rhopaloa]|uniref:Integumentary mucin C.1-like n=1 Tax=Drosophila rhopaloa TaxID=1041015 RepID=A0ABM5J6N9_DRORH|nr:ELMO domain-containing protein C-like [Drosophila rhopaloa]
MLASKFLILISAIFWCLNGVLAVTCADDPTDANCIDCTTDTTNDECTTTTTTTTVAPTSSTTTTTTPPTIFATIKNMKLRVKNKIMRLLTKQF